MPTSSQGETDLLVKARLASRVGFGAAVRKAAGLTQAEVGREVGVSQMAVSRWESGERVPRGEAARRYGELLERLAPAQQRVAA
jgi:DNA-binding XRE family transcriptional regulator